MAVETTKGFIMDGQRYMFDRRYCSSSDGWAQLDCDQDAWYHGTWAHPEKFEKVAYLEGDVYHAKCDTAEEFKQEIAEWFEFQEEMGYNPRIDPMGHAEKWDALGYDTSDGLIRNV